MKMHWSKMVSYEFFFFFFLSWFCGKINATDLCVIRLAATVKYSPALITASFMTIGSIECEHDSEYSFFFILSRLLFVSVAFLLSVYRKPHIFECVDADSNGKHTVILRDWMQCLLCFWVLRMKEMLNCILLNRPFEQYKEYFIYMQMSAMQFKNQPNHFKCTETNRKNEIYAICKSLNFGGASNFDIYRSKLKGIELHDFLKFKFINNQQYPWIILFVLLRILNTKYNSDVISKCCR